MNHVRHGRRRLVWIVLAAVVVVAAIAVIGPFVYIHFIEGPARRSSNCPRQTARRRRQLARGRVPTVSGVWNVGARSVAGYRVSEVLIGQNSTAVGRTSKVWGSMTIEGATVRKGTFDVDMASVVSDQSSAMPTSTGRSWTWLGSRPRPSPSPRRLASDRSLPTALSATTTRPDC